MNDASDRTRRTRPSEDARRAPQEPDTRRWWAAFGIGLGFVIFMLIVVSISL